VPLLVVGEDLFSLECGQATKGEVLTSALLLRFSVGNFLFLFQSIKGSEFSVTPPTEFPSWKCDH